MKAYFSSNQGSMVRALVLVAPFLLLVVPAAPQSTTVLLPDCSSFLVTQVTTVTSKNIRGGASTSNTAGGIQVQCPEDRCVISPDGKCVARNTRTRSTLALIPSTTTTTTTTTTATNPPTTTQVTIIPATTPTVLPATTQATIVPAPTTQTAIPVTTPTVLPAITQATIAPAPTTQTAIPVTTPTVLPAITQATIVPAPTTQTAIPATTPTVLPAITQATIVPAPTTQTAIPVTTPTVLPATTQATIVPAPTTQTAIPVTTPTVLPAITQATIVPAPTTQTAIPATTPTVLPAITQATIVPAPTTQTAIPVTTPTVLPAITQATIVPAPTTQTAIAATTPTVLPAITQATIIPAPTTQTAIPVTTPTVLPAITEATIVPATTTQTAIPVTTPTVLPAIPQATIAPAPTTQTAIPVTTPTVLPAITQATIVPAPTTQTAIPVTTPTVLPAITQATIAPAPTTQTAIPVTTPTVITQATIIPLTNTQATVPPTTQTVLPATTQATIIPLTNTQATIPPTTQTVLPATTQATIASTTQATAQAVIPCANRNLGQCEDGDGRCLKVLNTCQPINGEGLENQRCLAALSTDSDGDLIYVEALGMGCAAGLVCNVANNSNSDILNVQLEGICEPEACVGKKIPGSCNGNNPKDVDCNSATKRVTICHRTCSEKNPWVRITIDDSAWNGQGCGHHLQHDVRDECRNKAPWTAWGNHFTDFLLKEHGTRADVAAKFNNKAQEKAYWKKWERACPSVRNGECCDWNDPDNLCCGDAPNTSYEPKIELKKYAGPVGKCSAAGIAELSDDTYTLPNATSEWQYCYVVSVPPTSKECLYKVTISDPMLAVGSLRDGLMNVTTGNTDFLCPGEVKYIEGEVEKGVEKYEKPSEAKAAAIGVLSLRSVYDLDFAGVDAPITLESTTEIKVLDYEKDLCLYLSVDPPECPEDVVLLAKGLTEFKVNPIVLSSQDEETVTFTITNPFGRKLSSVFYQYARAENGGTKCYEESDPSTGCPQPIEVTAHCMVGPGHPPFAIIHVWFVDQSFADDVWNNKPVPKCCHPEDDTPAIEYTFQVFCKSQCAPDVVGSG